MRIWGLFVVSVVGCREGLGGWGVVCMCVYDWGERGRVRLTFEWVSLFSIFCFWGRES